MAPPPQPQPSRPASFGITAGTRLVAAATLPVVAAIAAALTALALAASGSLDSWNGVLVAMGFDPDRAQLIVALLGGGLSAAVATLVAGTLGWSVLAGAAVGLVLFGPTFIAETKAASSASGAFGSFDPVGWIVTVLAWITFAVISAGIGTALVSVLRPHLVVAGRDLTAAIRDRRHARAGLRRPIVVGLAAMLLIVTLPFAGDLFNYGADARMTVGGPPRVGLVPEAAPATPSQSIAGASFAIGAGTASQQPSTSSSASPSPSPDLSPWTAWQPSGQGTVTYLSFAGPWSGQRAYVEVGIYLPPGYSADVGRRYPTVYEVPWFYGTWNGAIRIKSALDTMIDRGTIPASIYVFMPSGGAGPYPDSQCANSLDGREWMDTYMSTTVPAYVDAHYRTIRDPAARAILGMSEGGYCAATLTLRHPNVFATAVSFSGYYTAGATGLVSSLPFGGNRVALAAYSPSVLATKEAATEASRLDFIVVADPAQAFYGSQTAGFAQVLEQDGYQFEYLRSTLPHGWSQVRALFGTAVTDLGTRWAATGVFTSP